MKRREFLTGLGVAAAWPASGRAETSTERRKIGMLMNADPKDPEWKTRTSAFFDGLERSGWVQGRNVDTELRWGAGSIDNIRSYAAELVALRPDVIVATGSSVAAALLAATRNIPIVFVQTPDPVGAGLVNSLARPGGNATGFTNVEYGMSGKWLELLREILPQATRALVLRDENLTGGAGQLEAIKPVAASFGIDVMPCSLKSVDEIERSITKFAERPDGGMIVTTSAQALLHRNAIIKLAASLRIPAIYPQRTFAATGGLISYGADSIDPYQHAAEYVSRILKGDKPADLPVQAPTKYELVINLKTAKTLGLAIPATLLATADDVIE
jgi:putative ABC transport system substrate-binding protein